MAEFSPSTIPDLPRTSADTLQRGNPLLLGWLKEWTQEGDLINRSDPSYEGIERAQQYVVGEQLSTDQRRLKYLPQITINETRKAMQAHVSAITDLKPIVGWRTNPEWRVQADLLNQYLLAEWVTTMMDIDLGDTVKYALVCGTGDTVVDWDPHVPLGGAHQLSARDPRDTLPLRPSFSRSPQLWEGVCFREEHTVNALKGMYPTYAHFFKSSTDSALGRVMGRFRVGLSRLLSPSDPLDQIGTGAQGTTRRRQGGALVLYRAYFKDRTRNLTGKAFAMGRPGSNWAYVVQPGEALYPRGRLIVATDDVILYDDANTYWHGMHPFCRLKLWSVPWQFLGIPLFNDLLPVQDSINDTMHDIRLGIRQWMDPDITYNRNAVSESTMKLMDPRRPGKKVKVMPGFGEPWKKEDGPNPQVLAMGIDLWEKLTQKFADMAGTANLQALLQLRQMPSADTIQKYYEALTPEIRQEARQVEAYLRDLSEMLKVNYFQFLSTQKRLQILGGGGVLLNDFDFDPGQLVPALSPADQGYTPELDAINTTRDQRAQYFHKQFVFVVAPNSVLAMDATERKMLRLQLARMGYYDFWSLHETLETPNIGAPPKIPLPPLEAIPPGVLEQMMQQTLQSGAQGLAMLQAGGAPPQYTDPQTKRTFTLDLASGQLLELRIPNTVTERLIAQQLMGIGQTTNPAGRKASGQEPPKQETQSDGQGGSRSTIRESRK
jgi:hypothetical protein